MTTRLPFLIEDDPPSGRAASAFRPEVGGGERRVTVTPGIDLQKVMGFLWENGGFL